MLDSKYRLTSKGEEEKPCLFPVMMMEETVSTQPSFHTPWKPSLVNVGLVMFLFSKVNRTSLL